MKQRVFSPRLYWEGMRQLRLMGILFSAAASLIAVFSPLAQYINYLNSDVLFSEITPDEISGISMNPLIILAFCIVAPFLTLNLFSFLNKRESSDFYHNIPATRTCLFLSFFAAVISWLLIFVVSTTVISTAVYALFPQLFVINYVNIAELSLSCFIGGFLVAASVAIAMSVTGTMLVNILMALILIFLPRTLISLVIESVNSAFPLVDGLDFAPFLSAKYNIPGGFVMTVLTEGFYTAIQMFHSVSSMLYTLVLGLIYTAIALLLFCKRRSEGAGHSAPTPHLQALFRFLVGFAVSSVITLALYLSISNDSTSSYDMFVFFFLYLLTAFMVAVFEILCTRRWKGLIRRCGGTVLLLAAANLALVGGLSGTNYYLSSYSPTADDISSVKFLSFDSYSKYRDNDTESYFDSKAAKVEITDRNIREIVAQQLDETLGTLNLGTNNYYNHLYQNSSLIVSIQENGVSHLRRIIVKSDDIAAITKALSENSEYQQIYMKLPTNYSHIVVNNTTFLRGSSAEKLFETLQSEVRDMGFAQWYSLLNGSLSVQEYNINYFTVGEGDLTTAPSAAEPESEEDAAEAESTGAKLLETMTVYVPHGVGWASFDVPLNLSVLPKTADCYLSLYDEQKGSEYTAFLNALNGDSTVFDLRIELYNCGTINDNYVLWYGQDTIEEQAALFADLSNQLRRASIGSVNPTAAFVKVECGYLGNDEHGNEEYRSLRGYFTLNEEAFNILTMLEE